MFRQWLRPASPANEGPRPSSGRDLGREDCTDQDTTPHCNQRVSFSAHSTIVYGYPSTGGTLILPYCNGVDLSFLDLPRFERSSRSEDEEVEDRHCARMRMLGAWWFNSVDEYDRMQWLEPDVLARKKIVTVAWPQDERAGVWVLTLRGVGEAADKGLGAVWNAASMDERCEVIEKMGGQFYADPKECPDLQV